MIGYYVQQGRLWKHYRPIEVNKEVGLLTLKKSVAKRGQIAGFPHKSRMRMSQYLASQKKQFGLFITLTQVEKTGYEQLKELCRRFTDKYGKHLIIWKKEFQERGTPHYHLIIFGISFVPHRWLKETWSDINHQEKLSVCNIKYLPAGSRLIPNYIRKYILNYASKKQAAEPARSAGEAYLEGSPITGKEVPQNIGRIWGAINRESGIYADEKIIKVPDSRIARMIDGIYEYMKEKLGFYPYKIKFVALGFDY